MEQLRAMFNDQTFMKDLIFDLDDFLITFGDIVNPLTYLTGASGADEKEAKTMDDELEPFKLNIT